MYTERQLQLAKSALEALFKSEDQREYYVKRKWTLLHPPKTWSLLVSKREVVLICPTEAAQQSTSDHFGCSRQLPSVSTLKGTLTNMCIESVCLCITLLAACFICESYVTDMCLGQVTGKTLQGNCKRLDHILFLPHFFLSSFFPFFSSDLNCFCRQLCLDTCALLKTVLHLCVCGMCFYKLGTVMSHP